MKKMTRESKIVLAICVPIILLTWGSFFLIFGGQIFPHLKSVSIWLCIAALLDLMILMLSSSVILVLVGKFIYEEYFE